MRLAARPEGDSWRSSARRSSETRRNRAGPPCPAARRSARTALSNEHQPRRPGPASTCSFARRRRSFHHVSAAHGGPAGGKRRTQAFPATHNELVPALDRPLLDARNHRNLPWRHARPRLSGAEDTPKIYTTPGRGRPRPAGQGPSEEPRTPAEGQPRSRRRPVASVARCLLPRWLSGKAAYENLGCVRCDGRGRRWELRARC